MEFRRMKLLSAISVMTLAMSATNAALLDVTPGGFSELYPPQVFYWLLGTHPQVAGGNFFDPDQPKLFTWSPYEPLGQANFTVARTSYTGAFVSWNLAGTDYGAQFVLVEGILYEANIYASDSWQDIYDSGFINNRSSLQAIIFYGPAQFCVQGGPMKTAIEKQRIKD